MNNSNGREQGDILIERVCRAICRGAHTKCIKDDNPCTVGDQCLWWPSKETSARAAIAEIRQS